MQYYFMARRKTSDIYRRRTPGILLRPILLLAMILSLLSTGKVVMSFAPSFYSSLRVQKTRGAGYSFFATSLSVLSSPSAVPQNRSLHNDRNHNKKKNTSACMNQHKTSKDGLVLQPLVVCGPSGVGKGTIIQKYMQELGGSILFGFTVSHTTRQPRPGEIDGVHYHFTDVPTMKQAIQRNEFLEFAEVHGNWYGTSLKSLKFIQEIEEKLPLLDIDVQGVKNIKEWQNRQATREQTPESANLDDSIQFLDAKFIFIAPPSLETLKERLITRGTESKESLEKRTANAVAEVKYGLQDGNFDAIVINDDLSDACINFKNAIEKIYGNLHS
mmetsp:Transcript_8419/g.15885  ORF Transcript_8419/g.15885 Transcript_8419/m.15885 type:complete len:329 (+) Transcript_8419:69-1055(+)